MRPTARGRLRRGAAGGRGAPGRARRCWQLLRAGCALALAGPLLRRPAAPRCCAARPAAAAGARPRAERRKLVIVESPAKAGTIGKYLGDEFQVIASVGHIRDLIKPKDLPQEHRGGYLSKFGVDVESSFEPYYIVPNGKTAVVARLRAALEQAAELYLATDADREGEAIAWHLLQVLKPTVPVRRMVFTEITQSAIQKALASVRDLDQALVDAQETRRILDRIYGFSLSPVLWRRLDSRALSAGRVQTPALRLVVERENQRQAFVNASCWGLDARFETAEGSPLSVSLVRLDGRQVARSSDFDAGGRLKNRSVELLDEQLARSLAEKLASKGARAVVASVLRSPFSRRPDAPFTTSTLQQEAQAKLRLAPEATMRLAQSLYERGYISYMRTDSPALSSEAIAAARAKALELYGPASLAPSERRYGSTRKGSQEAHEAVRPAGTSCSSPAELKGQLLDLELKLYSLIWERTVASQMADSTGLRLSVVVEATLPDAAGPTAEFEAVGHVTESLGFLMVSQETPAGRANATQPALAEGQELIVRGMKPVRSGTRPPPQFTAASLIRELERRGIGRPSTYASIVPTLASRGYLTSGNNMTLQPSETAFAVIQLLEDSCSRLIEYDFTAKMEESLDEIASGDEDRASWLSRFYFGNDTCMGLEGLAEEAMISSPLRGRPSSEPLEPARHLGTDPVSGLDVLGYDGPEGSYIRLGAATRRLSSKEVLQKIPLISALYMLTGKKPGGTQARVGGGAQAARAEAESGEPAKSEAPRPDESWTVAALKAALRERRLPVSGRKADLLLRLKGARAQG